MARVRKNDGSIGLSSWRVMKPSEARAAHTKLIELAAPLTGLPAQDRETLTKAIMDGPVAPTAQLDVAIRLERLHGRASGLSRTWLLVAASGSGSTTARASMLLGLRLARKAWDVERAGGFDEAARLHELSGKWMKYAADIVHVGDRIEDIEAALSLDGRPWPPTQVEEKGARTQVAAPPSDTLHLGPTLVVVREIAGVHGDKEDKAFIEAWKPLTKPLRLAAGPALDLLRAVLAAEFPWLIDAIDRIVGDLILRRSAGVAWDLWRPTLLVGPPGSGKTRFARRAAELLGTGFGEVNAAGSSDNRALQGTARGWASTSPSSVLHVMRRSGTANPVILVDEIDKTKADGRNGDIRATLLTMLEPISARSWPDEALMANADLSAVNWLLAANDVIPIRGPLLTRLRVVEVPNPGSEHLPAILAGIRRDLARELGVRGEDLPRLEPEIEARLAEAMDRGVSLRRLRAAFVAGIQSAGGPAVGRTLN